LPKDKTKSPNNDNFPVLTQDRFLTKIKESQNGGVFKRENARNIRESARKGRNKKDERKKK
jgi:hypothetical protein